MVDERNMKTYNSLFILLRYFSENGVINNINIIIILMLFLVFSNFFPTLQLFFVQLCNYLEGSLFFLVSLLLCECQNVSREIIHCMKKPGHIANQHNNQLQVGSLTQLVEHCTGIAEVMCLKPVQA